jgi:hypothetical protein
MTDNKFIEVFQNLYRELDYFWEDRTKRIKAIKQMREVIDIYLKVIEKDKK